MAYVFQVDTGGTLTTGLVSYWKGDSTTDVFGSNTLTNNNSVTFPAGKVNNAFSFDGATQYMSVASPSGFPTGASARSAAFWVNANSLTGFPTPFSYGTATTNQAFEFELFASQLTIDLTANAGVWVTVSSTATWYLMIVTYPGSGTLWTCYVNNSSLSTANPGATPATGTGSGFNIGRRATTASQYLNGLVCEVGLWTKVLSSQEMTDLYNGGAGQTMVPAGGTTASSATTLLMGV